MATITEAELAAYLKKRDEQLYSRLLLNRVFQGTVTGVFGNYPNYLVQIERNGEQHSDGNTYPVVSNWEPAIGDVCDIIWRDDKVGLAAFPISSAALGRLPARHPYRCRFYNTSSPLLATGFVPLVLGNIDFDPSSMYSNGAAIVPVNGTYLVSAIAKVTGAGADMFAALWRQPAGGAGAQISQGNYAMVGGQRSSVLSDIRVFNKGDLLTLYIWTGSTQTLDGSPFANVLAVCLLSR